MNQLRSRISRFHLTIAFPTLLLVFLATVLGCQPDSKPKSGAETEKLLKDLEADKIDKVAQADSITAKATELLNKSTTSSTAQSQVQDEASEAILKVTSVPQQPDRVKPTEDDPSTDWMLNPSELLMNWELMYQANSPVGYSTKKVSQSIFADSKRTRTELTSVTRVSKNGRTMKQVLKLSTEEKSNGSLIRLSGSLELGESKRTMSAIVEDSVLVLDVDDNGNKKREKLEWRNEMRGPFAVEQSLLRRPLKEKEARLLRHLDPISGHIVETRLEAMSRHATPTMKGRSMPLREVRCTTRDGDKFVESKIWVDDDGNVLKSHYPSLDIRSFQVDEQRAAEFQLVSDLKFVESVKMPFSINESQRKLYDETRLQADQLVYRFQLKNSLPSVTFSNRTNQRVRSLDPSTWEIAVFRISPNRDLPSGVDRQDPNLQSDLGNSDWLELGTPVVDQLYVELANRAEEKDLQQRVSSFAKRLFEKFQTKEFDKEVRKLSIALQSDTLTPIEHAMALIATLRKDKIPARMAIGFVFNQSERDPAFALHAWVEFYADDRWHSVDSSDSSRRSFLDRIKLKELRVIDNAMLSELTVAANLCSVGNVLFTQ